MASEATGTGLFASFIRKHTIDPELVISAARERGIAVSGSDTEARLESLRATPRARLDPLATAYVTAAKRKSGLRGFLTGMGGPVTALASLPIELHQTGAVSVYMTSAVINSYGFNTTTEAGQQELEIAVAVGFGVEQVTVLGATYLLAKYGAADLGEQVATALLPRAAFAAVSKAVAPRLAVGQTGSKAASRLLPLAGGPIGAAINWYAVERVGERVIRRYQARHFEWHRHDRGPGIRP